MTSTNFITWNSSRISIFLFKFLIICSIIEISIYPSWETMLYIAISISGCIICKRFIFTSYNLLNYTASTLAISFYVFFFLIMPMPGALLEFKPVTYNLHSPIYTFTQILFLEIILIITHILYKNITGHKNFIRSTIVKYNFFTRLTSSEIWSLIIVSSIIYAYNILTHGLYNEDSRNTTASLPIGLYIINLLFAGFHQMVFLFFFKKFNIIKQPYTVHKTFIFIFAILLFILGIATNMRTASILTFANLTFTFIIYVIYYPFNFNYILKPKIIIPLSFMIFFFGGPFMDISKAMVTIRGERNGVSGMEMIERTLSSINKKNKLQEKQTKNYIISWDENYLSNSILNRFCSLKILDETLYHAERVGYANEQMQRELQMQIMDNLPGLIKDKIDYKKKYERGSLTDKLYSLSINSPRDLGGIKIGSLQGLGLAIFGYYYPLIIIPTFIIIFFCLDATILYRKNRIYFSLWFFTNILLCCYYFSDRHYYLYEFRFIMRTYIESIIFYIIVIYIIKRIPFIKH